MKEPKNLFMHKWLKCYKGGDTMAELTPKQQLFIKESLIDLNATQSAIRAGYSKKNADKIGSELLGKTRIKEAIEKSLTKRTDKLDITAEYVLNSLKEVAEASKARNDSAGANRSLELLGKYLKLFTDKQEIDATIDTTIKVELTDD